MSAKPSGRDRVPAPPRSRPGPTAERPVPPPARSAPIGAGLPRPFRTGAPEPGRDGRARDFARSPPGVAHPRPAESTRGRGRAASRLLPGRFPRACDGGPTGTAAGEDDRRPAPGGPARPGGAPADRRDRDSLSDHDLSPRSALCRPGLRPPDGQVPAPGPRHIRRVDNRLLNVQTPERPLRRPTSRRPGRAARRLRHLRTGGRHPDLLSRRPSTAAPPRRWSSRSSDRTHPARRGRATEWCAARPPSHAATAR